MVLAINLQYFAASRQKITIVAYQPIPDFEALDCCNRAGRSMAKLDFGLLAQRQISIFLDNRLSKSAVYIRVLIAKVSC